MTKHDFIIDNNGGHRLDCPSFWNEGTMTARKETWTIYNTRVLFEREGRTVQRSYVFPTAMARDRFLEACKPLGGVAVRLGIDHVMTPEQALAELAEDEFFTATEPAE